MHSGGSSRFITVATRARRYQLSGMNADSSYQCNTYTETEQPDSLSWLFDRLFTHKKEKDPLVLKYSEIRSFSCRISLLHMKLLWIFN